MRTLPLAGFLSRRLLGAIVTLLVLSVIVYGLFYLLPTDPARLICGPRCSPPDVAAVSRAYGLDQPVYLQYWHWISNALQGNLGFSYYHGQSVDTVLAQAAPITISLVLGAAVIWIAYGVLSGIISAVRSAGLRSARSRVSR